MVYLVSLTARAQRDQAAIFHAIGCEDSAAARKWYASLKRAIFSLDKLPDRCPLVPENFHLRHLLFGRKPHVYRVIYRIVENRKAVEVLHIRHGARKPLR
ncbi:MAG: type II toxin-antitoxin system RelE/ParE family toxin [Terracidiphilus sp.]|nr:type II toxin-antitoxin system RelE/ParE family toxin [Terracidiphilus sp.]